MTMASGCCTDGRIAPGLAFRFQIPQSPQLFIPACQDGISGGFNSPQERVRLASLVLSPQAVGSEFCESLVTSATRVPRDLWILP